MLRQILSMTFKDLKILAKDTGGIATLFLMPMMFIFVMTLALGGLFGSGSDSPIHILTVNEDSGPVGAQIVEDFKAADGFSIETEWNGVPLTRARAEALIADNTRNVAVVIPAGFSAAIEKAAFDTQPGQSPVAARIDLIVDPALSVQFLGPIRGTLAGLTQQAAMSAIVPQGVERFVDQVGQTLGGQLPPQAREALRNDALQATGGNAASLVEIDQTQPAGMQVEKFPNSVQQNVPGWTLFGVFFIANLLSSSVLEEKKVGTFRRLLTAPMSRATILLGKLLPNLIVNLIQIALMFAVGVFVMPLFGMPRLDLGLHPEALIVISIAASLTATGLGLMIAALGKTAEQVGGLTSLLVVTMAAIGGVMVPRFVMPEFLQTLGLITPHAWALDAYTNVIVRGYDLAHVLPDVAALLGFTAVFFGIALWRFRWD